MRTIHHRFRAGWVAALVATSVVCYMAIAGAGSALTQATPVNTVRPTITGLAQVGERLTAQNGTWENSPTSFEYQWQRCDSDGTGCVAVAGADLKRYALVQADVGHRMRVRVTAVNADGEASARSAPSEIVASNAAPLTNTTRPTITGEARVGQELTANEGTWTANPTSFAFQWQRCDVDSFTCPDVIGATGRTYGVRIADLGFRLRVQVTARKDGRSGTATSLTTAVVQPTCRSRTSDRRSGSSVSASRARVCTCASGSVTTWRGTWRSWSERRAPACARRRGASRPASHRGHVAPIRAIGSRLRVSADTGGTRSRFVLVMYRA
jgi:hypothetical protein